MEKMESDHGERPGGPNACKGWHGNSQVTLDEANAMLAEFESDKETAMDTLTDGDEGIQVGQIRGYGLFLRTFVWFSWFW